MTKRRDHRAFYRSQARAMRATIIGAPVVLAGILLVNWQNDVALPDGFWMFLVCAATLLGAGWAFTAFLIKLANRRP